MKKYLLLSLCLILFVSFMPGCALVHPTTHSTVPPTVSPGSDSLTVDWNMTAFLIQPDGTVIDTFPLPIKGTIMREESPDSLWINIDLPDDFRYWVEIAEPDGDICTKQGAYWPGDFVTNGFCYDKVENSPAWHAWAINTEKEYFIAYWGKGFGQYLVASTDPNVKPEDIMKHFEKFIEVNQFD